MNIELVEKEDTIDEKLDGKLVEHHAKYEEIHGEDKTIFISMSKHVRLHQKLRKEGKCNIPPKELARISANARRRTDKYIYLNNHKGYCIKGDTYDKCYKCGNLDKCIRDAKR